MKGCEIREKRSRPTVSGLTKNNRAEEKGSKRKNITTHTSQLSKRAKKRREKAASREQENFSKTGVTNLPRGLGSFSTAGDQFGLKGAGKMCVPRITEPPYHMRRLENPSWLPRI